MDTLNLRRGTPICIKPREATVDKVIDTKRGSPVRTGVFLEPLGADRSKVVNARGRIQAVPNRLLSLAKI
jgi:hypothetical protein